jgi:pimeloyl-ACP methyl ester carboxylesterase
MSKPHAPSRRVQLADHVVFGHRFRVGRWPAERRSSRPLLFFSGIGANIELLAPFLKRLCGRDVITFDMPGVGGSANYPSLYRLSAMADVAHQIMSDMGCEQVDVMGVSWGGMLAQEFAYRHPKSVRRLVLVATSPGMPMIPGSISTLWKMMSSHRYTDPESMRPFLETLYGGTGSGLGSYALRMQPPSSTGYLYQVLALIGWTSARKLTRVRAKTLILMGKDDKLVPPANGHILKFLLNDARIEVLEGAGHLLVLTHMDAAVSMIERFLDHQSPATNSRSQMKQIQPTASNS